MSRKEIPGRASLSFPASDGLLDVDQILRINPWIQINDFVQQNFMQDILNEFNEKMRIDPKLKPTDDKTAATGRRATSSSRKATRDRSGAARTKSEKSGEEKENESPASSSSTSSCVGDQGTKERVNQGRVKSSGRGAEARKKYAVRREEGVERAVKNGAKESEQGGGNKSGTAANRNSSVREAKSPRQLENANLFDERPIANREAEKEENKEKQKEIKASGSVENASSRKIGSKACAQVETKNESAATNDEISDVSENRMKMERSRDIGRTSPFRTSTPRREPPRIIESVQKEKVEQRCDAASNENDLPERRPPENLIRKHAARPSAPKRNPKTNKEKGRGDIEKSVKRESRKDINKRASHSRATKSQSKREEKVAATGRTIGTHERRLREKEEARRKRTIRRHERKAQRAMEEFSRHVTTIAKKMGYLPGNDHEDDHTDSSDESSYSCSCSCSGSSYRSSSYSCSSSCSCSCSCSSSCSCDDSTETDRYSEYTLDSCSGHDGSSSSEYTDD